MKRMLPRIFCFLLSISFFADSFGQRDVQRTAKLTALKKDTAFKRFQSELANIMKTAKGRKTNFAAVKSLFANNKPTLQGLQKRHNLVPGTNHGNANQFIAYKDRPLASLANTAVMPNIYNYELTGPFTASALPYSSSMEWGSTVSSNKITFTKTDSGDPELGSAAFYFSLAIKTPNDPQVVGVRVEFDYAFFTTGWDTEGGELTALLCFYAYNGFESPAYKSMPVCSVMRGMEFLESFKMAAQLYNQSFSETDDFVYSRNSTFAIEGYVKPGESNYLLLGVGYPQSSTTGYYGAYHFGEFELKKVRVKFLKAGE